MVECYLFCHKAFSHVANNDGFPLFCFEGGFGDKIKKGERRNRYDGTGFFSISNE